MNFSNGKLDLIFGTMFSGKTTYMLSKIAFFADLGYKILYLNIEFDNRAKNIFSTHNPFLNSEEYSARGNIEKNVLMVKTKTLKNIENIDYKMYDIIFIDEAHFFPDLVDCVKELLNNKKYVIVGSLIGDFRGEKFGNAIDLIPICDDIHRLQAYCSECAKNKECRIAIYSKRINDTQNIIQIGGGEKYVPVCRSHFIN